MNAKRATWIAAGLVVWPMQYLVWVPLVLLGRVTRFALRVGGATILLLFIPIIGWIILFFMLLSRRDDRNFRRLLESEGHAGPRSVWQPWLINQLTDKAESTD